MSCASLLEHKSLENYSPPVLQKARATSFWNRGFLKIRGEYVGCAMRTTTVDGKLVRTLQTVSRFLSLGFIQL
jgi:hypothetical protein